MIVLRVIRHILATLFFAPFIVIPLVVTFPLALIANGARVGWLLAEEALEWWADEL